MFGDISQRPCNGRFPISLHPSVVTTDPFYVRYIRANKQARVVNVFLPSSSGSLRILILTKCE